MSHRHCIITRDIFQDLRQERNTVNSLYSELRYNEEHYITDYQCGTDFNIRKKS